MISFGMDIVPIKVRIGPNQQIILVQKTMELLTSKQVNNPEFKKSKLSGYSVKLILMILSCNLILSLILTLLLPT